MKDIISVPEAEDIIQKHLWKSNPVTISTDFITGKVLAEDLLADRDLPPFHRVMMDGIALKSSAFNKLNTQFKIQYTLAAGDEPTALLDESFCIEIMTGSVLPEGCDAVVRYEDVEITEGICKIHLPQIEPWQNVHLKGFDKKKDDILVKSGSSLRASEAGIAASIGKTKISVKAMPRVAVISTGDELVEVNNTPKDWQIRRSNAPALLSLLQNLGIPGEDFHLNDNRQSILDFFRSNEHNFDCFLFSGGVSKGKFDYLPGCFEDAGYEIHVHGVKQRPGKPFLFASKSNQFIFGFPGNPVSTLVSAIRYFRPWLFSSIQKHHQALWAQLKSDFNFNPQLCYFLEVNMCCDENALLTAVPVKGHGSGDLANLSNVSGFLELPEDRSIFKAGEVFPYWPITNYE